METNKLGLTPIIVYPNYLKNKKLLYKEKLLYPEPESNLIGLTPNNVFINIYIK